MSLEPVTDFRIQHLRRSLGELYEFKALLGRGAFASVYLVRNLRLNRFEALKVLSETHDGNEVYVKRFTQEAKLVASLDHPNIVKVYDFGRVDGILWFSMQYIDGPSLRAELEAQGWLAPEAVVHLAIPLLEALGYSHQMGTVHRDIKPSNILLDHRGRPYLMDFGIAKSRSNVFKTATGNVLGTPAYVSPEQIRAEEVDGRADLYSLAAAMYEMLAGRPPFESGDSLRTIVMRLEEDAPPLSDFCPSIDKTIETVVMCGLARQPENRYPDAEAMRRALAEFSGGQAETQGMVLKTSVPKPVPIEDLAPTPVDRPAAVDLQEAPTIQLEKAPPVGESSRSQGPNMSWVMVWLAALMLGVIAIVWFQAPWEDPIAPRSRADLPAAPASQEDPAALESSAGDGSPEDGSPEDGPPTDGSAIDVEATPPATVEDPATGAEGSLEMDQSQANPEPAVETPPPEARPTSTTPPPVLVRRPMTVPKIISSAKPVVPSAKAGECIGRSFSLSLRVGEDGRVSSAKILRGGSGECATAARTAAEAYLFEPALDIEELPVEATTTINISFEEAEE